MADTEFQPLQFKSEEGKPKGSYDWLADLEDGQPSQSGAFHVGLESSREASENEPAEEGKTESQPFSGTPEELEQLREEARREGYEQGRLEGREKGEEEGREAMERVQATFLDSFEQALKAFTEGQPEVAAEWREPLQRLTRTICERVLRQALDDDLQGYLERLVEAGMEALESAGELRVTLGDVTPGLVEELRERLQAHPGMAALRLHMETDKPADFVRIEADYGVVQTTLDSQLDQVATEVGEGLAGS